MARLSRWHLVAPALLCGWSLLAGAAPPPWPSLPSKPLRDVDSPADDARLDPDGSLAAAAAGRHGGLGTATIASTGLKVLVLRVFLKQPCALAATAPTATVQDWKDALADTNAAMGACTAGATSLNNNYQIVDVSVDCTTSPYPCDDSTLTQTWAWASSANATAKAKGVNLGSFDHIMYDLPQRSCAWSAQGIITRGTIWVNNLGSIDAASRWEVLIHEQGHNYGANHPLVLSVTSTTGSSRPASAGLDRMRSAVSYHLNDNLGPHCYLLPQLALHLKVSSPPTLTGTQLTAGAIKTRSMKPYYAAKDAGLMINPTWANAAVGINKWRVWVSYSSTDGYSIAMPPTPTIWQGTVLVHLTSFSWVDPSSLTQDVYRIATLRQGEAYTVPRLGLVIKFASISSGSANVRVCRKGSSSQYCSTLTNSAVTTRKGPFQLKLPYISRCLRACPTSEGATCGLPAGYPSAWRNVYFTACGTDSTFRWNSTRYSNGYTQYKSIDTGLCLAVGTTVSDDVAGADDQGFWRPRLLLRPCSATISWSSDTMQFSSQMWVQRPTTLPGRTEPRLAPAIMHPDFGMGNVVIDACTGNKCTQGLPASSAGATAFYAYTDEQENSAYGQNNQQFSMPSVS